MEVTVGAVVRQSSGEDWSDVELVLPTVKPKLGAEAPYPAPLAVGGHEQKEAKVLVRVASSDCETLVKGVSVSPCFSVHSSSVAHSFRSPHSPKVIVEVQVT